MSATKVFIDRPVFTVVLSLILILLGAVSVLQLDVRSMPNVFVPGLEIDVYAPGSSAEFVEKNIVTPLEEKLQNTSNIDYIYSSSSQGMGEVDIHFTNISQQDFLAAQTEVMQEVSATHLPDNVNAPTIRPAAFNKTKSSF